MSSEQIEKRLKEVEEMFRNQKKSRRLVFSQVAEGFMTGITRMKMIKEFENAKFISMGNFLFDLLITHPEIQKTLIEKPGWFEIKENGNIKYDEKVESVRSSS